uniref:Uncharacterized protein n=1 Tax=Rhizophora mucronata TaxID=61149 RepID=A0A2P2IUA5_RHIMU
MKIRVEKMTLKSSCGYHIPQS